MSEEKVSSQLPSLDTSTPRSRRRRNASSPTSSTASSSPSRRISSKQWRSAVSVQALCDSLREGQREIAALQSTLDQAQSENSALLSQMREAAQAYEKRLEAKDKDLHLMIENLRNQLRDKEEKTKRLEEENRVLKERTEAFDSEAKLELDSRCRDLQTRVGKVIESRDKLKIRILSEKIYSKERELAQNVFHVWHKAVNARRHRAKLTRVYLWKIAHHRLLKAMAKWKLCTHQHAVESKVVRRLVSRCQTRTVKSAFEDWKQITTNMRRIFKLMRKLQHRSKRFDLYYGFREWLSFLHLHRAKEIVSNVKTDEDLKKDRTRLTLQMLRKVLDHWKHVQLRRAFNTWHVRYRKDDHKDHVMRLVLSNMLRRTISSSFRVWHLHTIGTARRERVLSRTNARMTHRDQLRAWRTWCSFVERRRAVQGVLDHAAVRTRKRTYVVVSISLSLTYLLTHLPIHQLTHTDTHSWPDYFDSFEDVCFCKE
jgi:hypothetical protein